MIAYLLEIRHGGSFFGGPSDSVAVHYGAIPYELTHPGKHCDLVSVQLPAGVEPAVACQGQPGVSGSPSPQPATWETVFTAMFFHGSFLHIRQHAVLAIFGPTVEDAMSRPRYLAFVPARGPRRPRRPGARGTQLDRAHDRRIRSDRRRARRIHPPVPRARVLSLVFIVFFVTIIEVPAVFLLGFWFLEQLFFGADGLANPVGGEGVAYFAHVGGFIFGLLLIRLFARRRTPPTPVLPGGLSA